LRPHEDFTNGATCTGHRDHFGDAIDIEAKRSEARPPPLTLARQSRYPAMNHEQAQTAGTDHCAHGPEDTNPPRWEVEKLQGGLDGLGFRLGGGSAAETAGERLAACSEGQKSCQEARDHLRKAEILPKKLAPISEGQKSCPKSSRSSPKGRNPAQKARAHLRRAEILPKKLAFISERQKSCPKSSRPSPRGTVLPPAEAELRSGPRPLSREAARLAQPRRARECCPPE